MDIYSYELEARLRRGERREEIDGGEAWRAEALADDCFPFSIRHFLGAAGDN